MSRNAISSTVIVLAVLLVGCNETGSREGCASTFDAAAMRTIIEKENADFTRAHITGDSLTLINYFTPDAKVFPPNSAPVIGHAAIAVLNAEWVGLGIHEFREETNEIYGCGDILIDEGSYVVTYGDDRTTEEGKYLNVWKREDGEWKVYSNMWSSSSPAIPPAES